MSILPREDYPPSFIRPFEGVFGRSFNYESSNNDNNSKLAFRKRTIYDKSVFEQFIYNLFTIINNVFEQFIINLDKHVRLV